MEVADSPLGAGSSYRSVSQEYPSGSPPVPGDGLTETPEDLQSWGSKHGMSCVGLHPSTAGRSKIPWVYPPTSASSEEEAGLENPPCHQDLILHGLLCYVTSWDVPQVNLELP